MICKQCGFENKKGAKFCTKCGSSLDYEPAETPAKTDNSKYIIIALIAIIALLVGTMGYFLLTSDNGSNQMDVVLPQNNESSTAEPAESDESAESEGDDENVQTESVSSNKVSDAKSWVSIGSYSGSGSGSETIKVPSGKIMVKLSAYPIKNYATNHLYVSGSNGESGGVDWGSKSKVETRSDSFTYESSSDETFNIDYYETVEWKVDFYRYQ